MAEKKVAIELKNISKSFPGVKALDNVSFTVNEGECHVLVGENGAGKSTLIKCINGMYTAEDRKSTRLNSSHTDSSRMPSSA